MVNPIQPPITIIIPTHNRSDFLKDAIDSCYRSAAGLEVEIIVVDDASEEDIETVASGCNAIYIRLEENSGANAARNTGKSVASGEYLKFLDSDDVLIDGVLREEYAEARRTGADIVVTGWEQCCLDENKGEILISSHAAPIFESVIDDLLQGKSALISSALYSKKITDRIDWDEELKTVHDWDFFIRAALDASSIVSLSKASFRWRHHDGDRITGNFDFLEYAMAFFRVLGKLEAFLKTSHAMTPARRLRLAQYYYKQLRVAYRFDPPLGKTMLNKLFELDPDFWPRDEERSKIFRWFCRVFPVSLMLSVYGAVRRNMDRLQAIRNAWL